MKKSSFSLSVSLLGSSLVLANLSLPLAQALEVKTEPSATVKETCLNLTDFTGAKEEPRILLRGIQQIFDDVTSAEYFEKYLQETESLAEPLQIYSQVGCEKVITSKGTYLIEKDEVLLDTEEKKTTILLLVGEVNPSDEMMIQLVRKNDSKILAVQFSSRFSYEGKCKISEKETFDFRETHETQNRLVIFDKSVRTEAEAKKVAETMGLHISGEAEDPISEENFESVCQKASKAKKK